MAVRVSSTSLIEQRIGDVIDLSRSFLMAREFLKAAMYRHHPDFYGTLQVALQGSFFMNVYQLFDQDTRTASLSLLARKVNQKCGQSVDAEIEKRRPLLKKVFEIRSNVYAHRNRSRSPEKVFAEAKFLYKDLQELIDLAKEVLVTIAAEAGLYPEQELKDKFREADNRMADAMRRVVKQLSTRKG